jgi:reverse gyrase
MNSNDREVLEKKLKEFANYQRHYIELEAEEEIDQARRLLKDTNLEELESKGILISSLELSKQLMSIYGRYELILKRSI